MYNIKGEINASTKENNYKIGKERFYLKKHGVSHDFNENDMLYILKETNIEGSK